MKHLIVLCITLLVAVGLVVATISPDNAISAPPIVNLDEKYVQIEKASKAFDIMLKIQTDLVARVETLEKKLKIKPGQNSFRVTQGEKANE